MMQKIETIHLLQDSNQLLREEKDRVSAHIRELQCRVGVVVVGVLVWLEGNGVVVSCFYKENCILSRIIIE